MVISELIQRSPIRVLEQSIGGALKSGEMGIIAAPSGIGKTSVLVQIALDRLLQNEKVIHISFTKHTDYVLVWYKDIFSEFTRKKNLENADEVKNAAVKNRVLMKFNQEGFAVTQILNGVRAMIKDGGFNAASVIIDCFDFSRSDKDYIAALKSFAGEMGLSIWCSCNVKGDAPYNKQNIPLAIKDCHELFEVIIVLQGEQDHIALTVSKDRKGNCKNPGIKLDPKTLLMLEH
jgi:hypothetical protein